MPDTDPNNDGSEAADEPSDDSRTDRQRKQNDTLLPAVEEFQDLRDHDDEAVRRIANGTVTRLARERPEAVGDG